MSLPDAPGSEGPPSWAVRQAAEDLPDGSRQADVTALAWELTHAAADRRNEEHDEYDDPDEGGEA